MTAALSFEDVSVTYVRGGVRTLAVDGVSLTVAEHETVALVGESGSGKTTLARVAVGLVTPDRGVVRFAGEPIARRGTRGIGMVFQDPLGSLDPRMRIGDALVEIISLHGLRPRDQQAARVSELLDWVGLAAGTAQARPRELSGGQQQRAAIARALAAEPSVLILDEPVSALDVSVRAQVLRLLTDLQAELGLAYLFIGHDLAVVRQLARRVAVMYRGKLVEEADATEFFAAPSHEYSRALLAAVPSLRKEHQ
jgi:peptide/nickel transport system ATP-binding protein